MKHKIYLDDVRTPLDPDWIVVRSYDEFVEKVKQLGIENIETVSLDHDLGDSAMQEYYTNVSPNYALNYANIKEKTGYDCAKWLIDFWLDSHDLESAYIRKAPDIGFPTVYTHSANPIGSANIMGYINNFLMNLHRPQTCVRVRIDHTV